MGKSNDEKARQIEQLLVEMGKAKEEKYREIQKLHKEISALRPPPPKPQCSIA
jgi:hypothetical protein